MSDLEGNPFSGLFSSVKEAQTFSEERHNLACHRFGSSLLENFEKDKEKSEECELVNPPDKHIVNELDEIENVEKEAKEKERINQEIENIFLITFDKVTSPYGRPAFCIYMEDLHIAIGGQDLLDMDLLESALFERLMLSEPDQYVVKTCEQEIKVQHPAEARIIFYLFQSYCRIDRINYRSDLVKKCENSIFRNVQMALTHSSIFSHSNTCEDLLSLLTEFWEDGNIQEFVNNVILAVEQAAEAEETSVKDTFSPIFHLLAQKLQSCSITDLKLITYIQMAQLLTSRVSTALAFMKHSTPLSGNDPKAYQRSLLGSMLNISSLPQSANGPYEFFNNPARLTQMEQENTEKILWTPLKRVSFEVYRLLLSMLRRSNPELKNAVCSWIGSCLQENNGRSKLWHHLTGVRNLNYVSDGFILNLSSVLLRFCEPIYADGSAKLLLVDPTYCAVEVLSETEGNEKGIHMGGLSEETCLLSSQDDRPQKDSYNFITECFYMAHKSLQIGFHSLHERMTKLITEIRRLQRLYTEAVESGGENSEAAEAIKKNMEQGTTIYFSAKTHMVEPETLKMMLAFYATTTKWLVNLAISEDQSVFHDIDLPLPPTSPSHLCCIPEFIVDNIADFTTFLRRFAPSYFEIDEGDTFLFKLLYFILAFMGSPEKMKNPHLRAKLAEMLENVMPHPDESNPHLGDTRVFAREQVFKGHPYSEHIVPVLMHVFVSIEMTGQSVAFEQKFNYRRPMYEVLEYIWNIEFHRQAFQRLALESEQNIKDPDAPLFLRFINLLMNDANYLLDEGLMYVSKLRDHQQRRETEEFRQLPLQQRQEADAAYRHSGMLARFHNIMGRQTINTLKLLTSEIKSIFVHPINVERIANMLNYFLLHLVGPKRKQFKLQDKEEFDFKPQDLVSGICHIYVNLGSSKRFLTAIASDGRSYSSNLLVQAESVLCRIGEVSILSEFQNVASRVKDIAEKLKIQEENMDNVPEEFLDAILGTLMSDPVTLPSSMVVVDRSTIARHLLSDQSDPFNRSPLTMDMVKPNPELAERIHQWLKENSNNESEN